MQKNYRFRNKQKRTVLITVGGADLKAKFDSSKKYLLIWGDQSDAMHCNTSDI